MAEIEAIEPSDTPTFASCSVNENIIPHHATFQAYLYSSLTTGSCSKHMVTVTCNDGELSETNFHFTCQDQQAHTDVAVSASRAWGPVCSVNNAMAHDGAFAGLTRTESGFPSLTRIDGSWVSSCIDVNFSEVADTGSVDIHYRHQNTICGDSCSGSGCNTSGGALVFSNENGNWKYRNSLPYTKNATQQTVSIPHAYSAIRICRAGAGRERANLAIDSVTRTNNTSQNHVLALEVQLPEDETSDQTDLTSCSLKQLSPHQESLVDAFDRWDQSYNNGLGYSDQNNQQGILANNKPSIILGYLKMYEATGDIDYLRRVIEHGDRILSHRDDVTGFTDYTGNSHPVWSDANPNYVSGTAAYPFLLESGLLTYPLAYFSALVMNDDCLKTKIHSNGSTYQDIAQRYIARVEETVAYHHKDWHTGSVQFPIGFYTAALTLITKP